MNIQKLLSASVLGLTLIGGGCLGQTDEVIVGDRQIDQLITFDKFDEDKVSVGMPIEEPAAPMFSADALLSLAQECGTAKDLSYYLGLMTKLDGVKAQIYSFGALPDANYQTNGWTVTVIPNVFGYKNLQEFKTDFDICAAGETLYPHEMNNDVLIFTASCGSGYADDTGRENGCDVVRKQVEPTIKIK